MMVFHASTTTPLYLLGWQPISAGQYAGTCIFLIVLGTFTRITLALKPVLEARRWRPASHAKSASTEHHEVRRGGISWLATVERALYDVLVAALGYLLYVFPFPSSFHRWCTVYERCADLNPSFHL